MTIIRTDGAGSTQNDPTINDMAPPPAVNQFRKNEVTPNDHGDSTSQTQIGDGVDARETAKTVDQEVEEKLANDPDYQRTAKELNEAESLANDWNLVEANSLFANDGVLTKADIAAVAADPCRPQNVRDAAQRLLANSTFLTGVNGNDTIASAQDVANYVKGLRDSLKQMKADVKNEVKAERGIATNQNAATGDSGATGDATQTGGAGTTPEEVLAEAKNGVAPKPQPSTRGGLEGAEENASNMMGWMEGEFDRLTALMGKTDDPKVQKQLEMQLNQLSRRMQSMTAMLNQITTMMSNISKMYADIAMNSIRNMR